MSSDRDTTKLRALIERAERCRFWGGQYTITPRLISRVFGDGARLLCITPLATRPNYFVVRVDSSTLDPAALLDDIIEAAEEEYGHFGEERGSGGHETRGFPVVDWGIGCVWGESFPITEWRPSR